MTLTWKDWVTTALAALTVGFSYLMIKGVNLPIITGYRGGILVLLILGVGMCALSSAGPGVGGPWIVAASTLGVLALILIIAGLIMGTKAMFLAITGVIVLLWVIATVRHLIGG